MLSIATLASCYQLIAVKKDEENSEQIIEIQQLIQQYQKNFQQSSTITSYKFY